ncbi:hypothetical protein [Fodinicola acaciae]|uniref:hypothetical protein n=1 Tax=Fodinicola acaciae TaxID=2681555 RepID=UPI0013D575B9|nr:hypothetical protein [Fodinicola acaciae]
MPQSLRDVILDFHWDVDLLRALDLPRHVIATHELAWHLSLPFWSVNGVPFQVSPNEVAADPARHQSQWERTQAADLRHPVDAYLREDGQIVILDGIHRLLKASLQARPCMIVRVMAIHDFDAIAVTALSP